jgi:quinol monooxygenase YgiN
MTNTAVFVIGKAKPGKRDELRKLYMEHIRPRAEAETKQEMAVYCYSDDDNETICLFELFSSPKVARAEMQSDWFEAYMEKVRPLMAEPAIVKLATPVWTKGVSA